MDDEADVEGGRGAERVHRVTVRGQFRDLSEQSRQFLVRSTAEHDIFVSAYTPEGTFTYDDRIQFFNLRYEIRCGGDDPIGLAVRARRTEGRRGRRVGHMGRDPGRHGSTARGLTARSLPRMP